MKQLVLTLLTCCLAVFAVNGQTLFAEEAQIPEGYNPETIVMPPSPLTMQILFIGGVDMVQTTPTYGNPATEVPAKQWHDFIGFTPDNDSDDLGWVSINHEMVASDDNIGDGGGMTAFKMRRDLNTDSLIIVEQTLNDGRQGKFFNVDFVNTVGETGMNCGGITSLDGRIWTAEEWFRGSNDDLFGQVRDTAEVMLTSSLTGWDQDTMVEKYQTFNYMVEIDPTQAVALRKEYAWGRQAFEGGVVLPDNKTVILGVDNSPGPLTKFVADVAGDFTSGTLFAYKQDAEEKWLEIPNTAERKLDIITASAELGATLMARIEWVAYDEATGMVYMTETGRDDIGARFARSLYVDNGAMPAQHHFDRAQNVFGLDSPVSADYPDYYGRVLKFDPTTDEVSIHIAGGPDAVDNEEGPAEVDYFEKHLSNPDGLNVMTIDGQSFLVICEDLNGSSYGRVPAGTPNRTCEMFLLDLSIENPTQSDLIRISAVPTGAEITGAIPTPDGKSLLVNSQHPSTDNPFPFNNSLTFAIHGFDNLTVTDLKNVRPTEADFTVFPNPATRFIQFNKTVDVALYNNAGQRLRVYRQVNEINVSDLQKGMYYLQAENGNFKKLVIQ